VDPVLIFSPFAWTCSGRWRALSLQLLLLLIPSRYLPAVLSFSNQAQVLHQGALHATRLAVAPLHRTKPYPAFAVAPGNNILLLT